MAMPTSTPPPGRSTGLYLLVHGSPGSPAVWAGVQAGLDPDAMILTPRLPGHRRGDDAAALSDDLATRTAAVEAAWFDDPAAIGATHGGRVTLVGHSFGGVVALEVARRGRLPVSRLVLLEPVVVNALPVGGAEAPQVVERLRVYLAQVEAGAPEAIATMIDLWFGDGAYTRLPEGARRGLAAQAPVNARDVTATLTQDVGPGTLEAVDIPTTVVIGSRSPATTAAIGAALARRLPRAELVSLEGAGHDMLDTHAAELTRLLR